MGEKDSSLTRVQPVFDYINKNSDNLNKFLSLFSKKVIIKNDILEYKYGYDEKAIPPVNSLLVWCINNIDKLNNNEFEKLQNSCSETDRKRYLLFKNNAETKKEALEKLKEKCIPQKGWYIFEGYTKPDIYIETENIILIGEGKRTEPELTNYTKWMPHRDQLIRHIDSVIDRPKKVYSFLIVEDKEMYDVNQYYKDAVYKDSLPHRNSEDIQKIKDTYIGCTTWKEINEIFNNEIDYSDTVKEP